MIDRKIYDRKRYLFFKAKKKKKLSVPEAAELMNIKPETLVNNYICILDFRGNFVLINEKFISTFNKKKQHITNF